VALLVVVYVREATKMAARLKAEFGVEVRNLFGVYMHNVFKQVKLIESSCTSMERV
jgi:hypothetical protein